MCQTLRFLRDRQRLVYISHNKIYKQFALNLKFTIIMSQSSESKISSNFEVYQYPTIKSLASQKTLISLKDLDEHLNNLRLDVSSMCTLAFQIRNCMNCIEHSSQENYQYGIRLIFLIRFIFQHCSLHQYYLFQLMSCLNNCNQRWKRILIANLKQVNINPNAYRIFMYKTKRNIYLLTMLRTGNILLSKTIDNLLGKKQLNQKTINYLCQRHILISFEKVYCKMTEIMKQRQQETYLKILLLNQFIKYVLMYRNFCISKKDEANVYLKFFDVMENSFRMIKKFAHSQIQFIFENTFSLLQKGVGFYIESLRKQGNYIKIMQMENILRIIRKEPLKQVKDCFSNKAFVIKLVLKILKNWKSVYRKAQRSRKWLQIRQIQDFNITQQVRKQKQHNLKQHLEAGKIEQVKKELRKLNRSLSNLQKKRSFYKSERFGSCVKMTLNPVNYIKIRGEIQSDTFKDKSKSVSKQKKHERKDLTYERERQLKLEDYQIQRNSRKHLLPTMNKIQLYKTEKMTGYCSKKPKLKLDKKN